MNDASEPLRGARRDAGATLFTAGAVQRLAGAAAIAAAMWLVVWWALRP